MFDWNAMPFNGASFANPDAKPGATVLSASTVTQASQARRSIWPSAQAIA